MAYGGENKHSNVLHLIAIRLVCVHLTTGAGIMISLLSAFQFKDLILINGKGRCLYPLVLRS